MSTEKNTKQNEKNLGVGEVITNTENFIEKNQRIILIVIAAIFVIIGGYFAYVKLYAEPREKNALGELFGAEQYYKNDDFEKALKGDGKFIGLIDFIDKYGNTKSGNLAKFYAGTIYLNKGEYQNAIDYLEDFKSKDAFLSTQKFSLLGDANIELNQIDKAIKNYNKSLDNANDLTTPFNLFKLGLAYELNKDNKKALECYKRIKKEFPNSYEYRDIEKYIVRIENLQ